MRWQVWAARVGGVVQHGDSVAPELFRKLFSHRYHVFVIFICAPLAAVLIGAVLGFKVCFCCVGVVYEYLWLAAPKIYIRCAGYELYAYAGRDWIGLGGRLRLG